MFFRRRKKGPDPRPDDDFLEEDFGYVVEDDPSAAGSESTTTARPSRQPEPEDPEIESDEPSRPFGGFPGRSLEDATMVGGSGVKSDHPAAPARRRDLPPELPALTEEDDELPDATVVVGHAVPPSVTSVAWLVIASGPSRGRDHRLADDITRVGTAAECALQLPGDEYVSSLHAEVRRDGAEWILTDLGSTNGTFRNGDRITETRLEDGDRVRFGLSDFVFKSCRL